MHIDVIRELMRQINRIMEDLWIERRAYAIALNRDFGCSPEKINQIARDALANPDLRDQASRAFEKMRKALEAEAVPALIEALEDMPPTSGKPN